MSSDLKVTNIKHASSGSNNLVLASDGDISVTNNLNVGTIKDATGGTTALSINSSGIVTQPTKPAFIARTSGINNITLATHTTCFDQTSASNYYNLDQGNNYDTTNKEFEAPVAGIYYFHAQVDLRDHVFANASHYTTNLRLDTGSGYSTKYTGVYDFDDGGSNLHYFSLSISGMFNLSVNDKVQFSVVQTGGSASTTVDNGAGSYFLGYLIG
jgi:hypothetical protein